MVNTGKILALIAFTYTTAFGAMTNLYEWTFDGGNLSPAIGSGVLAFADARPTLPAFLAAMMRGCSCVPFNISAYSVSVFSFFPFCFDDSAVQTINSMT